MGYTAVLHLYYPRTHFLNYLYFYNLWNGKSNYVSHLRVRNYFSKISFLLMLWLRFARSFLDKISCKRKIFTFNKWSASSQLQWLINHPDSQMKLNDNTPTFSLELLYFFWVIHCGRSFAYKSTYHFTRQSTKWNLQIHSIHHSLHNTPWLIFTGSMLVYTSHC